MCRQWVCLQPLQLIRGPKHCCKSLTVTAILWSYMISFILSERLKAVKYFVNILWLIKCQSTRTPTEVCFPVCWGGRHQRWGLRQGHSLEFGAAGSYERLKGTQLPAGEEKGIPQPVFKFRVGKSETVVHTPLEMFTFQLALFPGLQRDMLFQLSAKAVHLCLHHGNNFYNTY